MGGGISFDVGGADNDDKAKKDPRRRNSLAYNIKRFNDWEEDEYTELVEEVRTNVVEQGVKKEKITKFSRMAENVLRGNNRELKFQVVNYQSINRKYGNQHNDSVLLHIICSEGYQEMFEFLLNPKNHAESDEVPLDIDAKNNKGRTPLQMCFSPPTATFLGQKFGVDEEGTPLNERPDGIESPNDWIKPGGPKSREKCIEYCLRAGADPNQRDFHDFTCLHYAAMWGWTPSCKLLLKRGADMNATNMTGKTALMLAVEAFHTKTVKFLANYGDPDSNELNAADADGQTALLIAMDQGDDALEMIETLVEAGADINMMNHKKKTPLHMACLNQSIKQVSMLLALKCQRRDSAFKLLEGTAKDVIMAKLEDEDKAALEEMERQELAKRKAAEEGEELSHSFGYKNKSPYGQWVEYVDKRDSSIFYYNKVSRSSQKDKPKDFIKDKTRIIKESTFGHAFYH